MQSDGIDDQTSPHPRLERVARRIKLSLLMSDRDFEVLDPLLIGVAVGVGYLGCWLLGRQI